MNSPDRPDKIDDLLREAGAAWRASQPTAPEPDLSRLQHRGGQHRRWVPVLAAASIAVVIAGISMLPNDSQPATGPTTGPSAVNTDGSPDSVAKALIVRDGDQVEVVGDVIAAPGKPVIYCPPYPRPAIGYAPGEEPAPTCAAHLAVELTGVDLDRLTNPGSRQGVRFGQATLRGIWRNKTIDVIDQSAPRAPTPRDTRELPCAEPTDGWKANPTANDRAISEYVQARPSQFGAIWTAKPTGTVRVLVVGVVEGDLDETRRELQKLYDGNLCVHRAPFSLSDLERADESLRALKQDRTSGIWASGGGPGSLVVTVELLVVDEHLYDKFAEIGLGLLNLRPAVRPVR